MTSARAPLFLDIETKRAEGLAQTLGMQEIMNRIANAEHTEDLMELVDEHEIALGNIKNFEPMQRKLHQHFSKIIEKAALKLYGASIYCIGVAGLNGPVRCQVVTEQVSEADVLADFTKFLFDNGPFLMVGFNIRGFDIPVLRYRCMINEIVWPEWLPGTAHEDRYDKQHVFDLMDVLSEGPLDTHLRVFGLPPKTGSAALAPAMTPEEVASYCADDVERERLLAQRVMPYTAWRHFLT